MKISRVTYLQIQTPEKDKVVQPDKMKLRNKVSNVTVKPQLIIFFELDNEQKVIQEKIGPYCDNIDILLFTR